MSENIAQGAPDAKPAQTGRLGDSHPQAALASQPPVRFVRFAYAKGDTMLSKHIAACLTLAATVMALTACEVRLDYSSPPPVAFQLPHQARLFYETESPATIAISGNLAVVGSRTESVTMGGVNYTTAGAAYLYELSSTGWSYRQRLVPPDPNQGLQFGAAVAISGDHVVIGAPNVSGTAPEASHGHVYFFEPRIVTVQLAKGTYSVKVWESVKEFDASQVGLIPAGGNPSQFQPKLGWSVAVREDFAVAGAPGYGRPDLSPTSLQKGAVALFSFSSSGGWVLDTTVTYEDSRLGFSSAAQNNANFGQSVAMGGTFAVAGAPNASMTDGAGAPTAEFVGMVAVLPRRDISGGHQWDCCTVLRPESPYGSNSFGAAVAVQQGGAPEYGNYIAVGEPNRNRSGTTNPIGRATVYSLVPGGTPGALPTANQVSAFDPPELVDNGKFGGAVSLSYPKLFVAGKRLSPDLPPYFLFYRHSLWGWFSSRITTPPMPGTPSTEPLLYSANSGLEWPEVLPIAKRKSAMDGTFTLYDTIVFRFRHWLFCTRPAFGNVCWPIN